MAPEQARGERDITPATDVFSLGCVLYECLTGRAPFVSEHIAGVLARILFEDPAPVEDLRPGVPAPLVDLLRRMLAKERTQRPADAMALWQEIAALGELHDAGPGPARYVLTPRPRQSTFAAREQELLSIVVAAPFEYGSDPNMTLQPSHLKLPLEARQALLVAIRSLKVEADFLADGTLIVTAVPTESAHDQAAQAARAALLIMDLWPSALLTMATGRGSLQGRVAIGEVVEQALRLLPAGGQTVTGSAKTSVILDGLSSKLLEGRFVQTARGDVHLLLGETEAMDASRQLLGKPTPCLGRDRELAMLDGLFNDCRDESVSRAGLVLGAPGIGKSRVRHEFVRRLKDRGEPCSIIFGRSDPMSTEADYGLISQAIRRHCEISDNEPLEERRRKLGERMSAVLPADRAIRVTEFLGELCAIPFPDGASPLLAAARQNPRVMNQQVQSAVVDWLTAECQVQPVLLVLEDLHWSDLLTVRLVDTILREIKSLPLLVLGTARPEVRHKFPALWAERGVLDVHLSGLGSKACERLVQQVLGSGSDAVTRQRIIAQAGGNPLFLEELMRALAEGNKDSLPETVLAMLQARQRKLDPSARRVLRAASVFGEAFWPSGIREILSDGTSAEEIEHWLDVLRDAEMVQAQSGSRFGAETEFRFQNALLRDAAYGMLADLDRQLAHRAAGLYLERQGERNAAVLAEHAHKGQEPERAAAFYVKAAQYAYDNGNLDGAIKLAEQAIGCGAKDEVFGDARRIQAWSHLWQGQFPRAAELADAALAHIPFGTLLWIKTIAIPIFTATMSGQRERAIQFIDQLLAFSPSGEAQREYMFAVRMILAGICQRIGTRIAEKLLRRVDEVLPESLLRQLQATHYDYYRHSEIDPWRQIKLSESMVEQLTENGMVREAKLGHGYIGEAHGEAGELERGESILRAALAKNTEPYGRSMFLVHLAALLSLRTDAVAQDEVLAICQEQLANPGLSPGYVGWCRLMSARVHLARGELAAAEPLLTQAIEVLRTAPYRRLVAQAMLIEVWARLGRIGDAIKLVEATQAEIAELGKVGYAELPVRFAVSLAYHCAGLHTQAEEWRQSAIKELYRRADLAPSAEARQRFLTQIPDNVRIEQLTREWETLRANAASRQEG